MNWCHIYIPFLVLDRADNGFFCIFNIIDANKNKLYVCEIFQFTRKPNLNGKPTVKSSSKIPWNKLFVYLIGPYKIKSKVKLYLTVKSVTVVNLVTAWF